VRKRPVSGLTGPHSSKKRKRDIKENRDAFSKNQGNVAGDNRNWSSEERIREGRSSKLHHALGGTEVIYGAMRVRRPELGGSGSAEA